MMIYMISESGAISTNSAATALIMESIGYHQCTLVEYRGRIHKTDEADESANALPAYTEKCPKCESENTKSFVAWKFPWGIAMQCNDCNHEWSSKGYL